MCGEEVRLEFYLQKHFGAAKLCRRLKSQRDKSKETMSSGFLLYPYFCLVIVDSVLPLVSKINTEATLCLTAQQSSFVTDLRGCRLFHFFPVKTGAIRRPSEYTGLLLHGTMLRVINGALFTCSWGKIPAAWRLLVRFTVPRW